MKYAGADQEGAIEVAAGNDLGDLAEPVGVRYPVAFDHFGLVQQLGAGRIDPEPAARIEGIVAGQSRRSRPFGGIDLLEQRSLTRVQPGRASSREIFAVHPHGRKRYTRSVSGRST
jgi:hypothetical protein